MALIVRYLYAKLITKKLKPFVISIRKFYVLIAYWMRITNRMR